MSGDTAACPVSAAEAALVVIDTACRLIEADRYGTSGEYGCVLMELTRAVDALTLFNVRPTGADNTDCPT